MIHCDEFCIEWAPKAPIKYKKLTQQDIIQKDDEYKTNWGSWTQIEAEFIGIRKGAKLGWYVKMRRPLKGKINHGKNGKR